MRRNKRRRTRLTRLSKILIFSVIVIGITIIPIRLLVLSKEGKPKDNKTSFQISKTEGKKENLSSNTVKPSTKDKTTTAAVKTENKKPQNQGKNTNVTNNSTNKPKSKKKTEDNKTFFAKSVFVGDSITEGFSYCDYMNESNIVAEKGMTVAKAKKRVNDIVKPKPENIFIMFGMNDVLYGMSSEKFAGSYLELIKMIKSKLPEANIYIESILPVEAKVEQKKPALNNRNIDNFNRSLIDMAKKENINYLNVASVATKSSESLHEGDGIHYKFKFYDLWLEYIKNNI